MKCHICGGVTEAILSKEANVSCGDYFEGQRLFPGNVGLQPLLACAACGFMAYEMFRSWSDEDFKSWIYNSDYHLCDAPFKEVRPRKLSAWLTTHLTDERLIDYGGGEGTMAAMLREAGHTADSYDPYYSDALLPGGRFDLVTAFEVVEHVPDQHRLFEAMLNLLTDEGVVMFSTLLRPSVIGADWWYASARNGHASFHSSRSLEIILAKFGFQLHSLSSEMHLAARSAAVLDRYRTWAPPQVNDAPAYRFENGWKAMSPVSA